MNRVAQLPEPERRWALVGGHLVDPGRRSITPGGVLIEDGQIVGVGPEVRGDQLNGVSSVDVTGRFIVPGLVDTHVHLSFDGGPGPIERFLDDGIDSGFEDRLAGAAMVALRSGVTTVRDLGGPNREVFCLRDAILTGRVPGPRVIASGLVLAPPGGHCHFIARPASGGTALAAAIREQVDAGADVIKVMVTGGVHTPGSSSGDVYYELEDLRAAARIAHARGRRITGHATNPIGIERAVLAGFDSIQHGSALDARLAGRMAERGTSLVPTLGTHAAMAEHTGDPRIPGYVAAKAQVGSAGKARAVRAAIEAGVVIAAGTDAGVTFVGHGTLARELALLCEAGLDSMEALAAATSTAAVEVGLESQVGRLAPGCAADLIVLDRDPVADIRALAEPRIVICRGSIVAREAIAPPMVARVS